VNGQANYFEAGGSIAGTAATDKSVKVSLGSTVVADFSSLAITSAADWHLSGYCVREDATHAKCTTTFRAWDGTNTFNRIDYTRATETLANALTLKLVTNGTNAADVVAEMWRQDWRN
jgi:hypothetical protein